MQNNSCYGVGVNTIDLKKATEKGIFVSNVPDYCKNEVSDHALSLLLCFARKIVMLNQYMRNGIWDFKRRCPFGDLTGKLWECWALGEYPET